MMNKFTIGWADERHEYVFYTTTCKKKIDKQVNKLRHMLHKKCIPYEYSFVKNGKEIIKLKVNV